MTRKHLVRVTLVLMTAFIFILPPASMFGAAVANSSAQQSEYAGPGDWDDVDLEMYLPDPSLPFEHRIPEKDEGNPKPMLEQPSAVVGEQTTLLILVEFADVSSTRNAYVLEDAVFANGATNNSVNNYYDENSYGKVWLDSGSESGAVSRDWLTLPQNRNYYGEDYYTVGYVTDDGSDQDGNWLTRGKIQLVKDACRAADAAGLDFGDYDNDGPDGIPNSSDDDGAVDHLIIIFSGNGQNHYGRDTSANSGPDDDSGANDWGRDLVWPSRISASSWFGSVDGTSIDTATVNPEDPNFDIPVGVICHEFGHDLGLPDLYDTDLGTGNGYGAVAGDWCLMDGGSYNTYGGNPCPAHLSAWCKYRLGWTSPVDVNPGNQGYFNINETSHPTPSDVCFRVNLSGYSAGDGEFFLIENRQQNTSSYDAGLPESGILIWHINDSISYSSGGTDSPTRINDGLPDNDDYGIQIENPTNPNGDRNYRGSIGSAAWSQDDGQTAFTPATTPSTNYSSTGASTTIYIDDIGSEAKSMLVRIRVTVDLTPPSTPGTPIECSPDHDYNTTGGFTVYWSASTDAESSIRYYELWEKIDSGSWAKVSSTISGTSYNFPSKTNGETYYYRVRAQNGAWLWGSNSTDSDGILVDTSAPAAPAWITDESADLDYNNTQDYTVYWAACTDAESGLDVYRLQERINSGGWTTVDDTLVVTSYAFSSKPANNYTYRVCARDVAGNWGPYATSDGIMVDVTAPTAPGMPTEESPDQDFDPDGDYTVHWPAAVDGGSGIQYYELQESPTGVGGWVTLSSTIVGTSYSPTTKGNGETYYYQVRALNNAGDWSTFSSVSDGIMTDLTMPPTPDAPTEGWPDLDINTTGDFTVNWTEVVIGTSGFKAYELQENVNSSGWYTLASNITEPFYNVTGRNHTSIYNYRVRAQNNATTWGLFSGFSDGIIIDTVRPTAPGNVSEFYPDIDLLSQTTLQLSWNASTDSGLGVASYEVQYELNSSGSWVVLETDLAAQSLMVNDLAVGGNYTFRVRANDGAGLQSNWTYSDGVIVDPNPPWNLSILINNGALWTNGSLVQLTLDAYENVTSIVNMSFSENGINWTDWEDWNTTREFNLTGPSGTKYVFFSVLDETGNSADPVLDQIILDQLAPVNLVLEINNGSATTESNVLYLYLNATDVHSGLKEMSFSLDGENWTGWEPMNPQKWISVEDVTGEKTVWFKVRDNVNNTSDPVSASILYHNPNSPWNVSLLINDDELYTNDRNVTLSIGAFSNISSLLEMRFSSNGMNWSDWVDFEEVHDHELIASSDGKIWLYLEVMDEFGNRGPMVRDSIILDTTAPVNQSVMINDGEAVTDSFGVSIKIAAKDELSGIWMKAYKVGDGNWTPWVIWQGSANISFSEGLNTVFFRTMDRAGNIAEPVNTSIIIDTRGPTVVLIINDGDDWTSDPALNLRIDAKDNGTGVQEMCFSEDGANFTDWEAYSLTRVYTVSTTLGMKLVYVRVRDGMGNVKEGMSLITLREEGYEPPDDDDVDDDLVDDDDEQDTDGDGIPDAWEDAYGMNSSDPDDAWDDPDGDGRDNLQEYRDNTDPTVVDEPPEQDDDDDDDSGNFLSDYWWVFLLVLVLIIVLIVIIGLIVTRKKKDDERRPPPEERREPRERPPQQQRRDPYYDDYNRRQAPPPRQQQRPQEPRMTYSDDDLRYFEDQATRPKQAVVGQKAVAPKAASGPASQRTSKQTPAPSKPPRQSSKQRSTPKPQKPASTPADDDAFEEELRRASGLDKHDEKAFEEELKAIGELGKEDGVASAEDSGRILQDEELFEFDDDVDLDEEIDFDDDDEFDDDIEDVNWDEPEEEADPDEFEFDDDELDWD